MLDELVARQDIVELVYYGLFDGPASELVAARQTGHRGFLLTRHQTGNVPVRIDCDLARAQSYLSAVHPAVRGGRLRNEHVPRALSRPARAAWRALNVCRKNLGVRLGLKPLRIANAGGTARHELPDRFSGTQSNARFRLLGRSSVNDLLELRWVFC